MQATSIVGPAPVDASQDPSRAADLEAGALNPKETLAAAVASILDTMPLTPQLRPGERVLNPVLSLPSNKSLGRPESPPWNKSLGRPESPIAGEQGSPPSPPSPGPRQYNGGLRPCTAPDPKMSPGGLDGDAQRQGGASALPNPKASPDMRPGGQGSAMSRAEVELPRLDGTTRLAVRDQARTWEQHSNKGARPSASEATAATADSAPHCGQAPTNALGPQRPRTSDEGGTAVSPSAGGPRKGPIGTAVLPSAEEGRGQRRAALVFIHGFNCSLMDGCKGIGQFMALAGLPDWIQPFVFSWPTGGLLNYLDAKSKGAEAPATSEAFAGLLPLLLLLLLPCTRL